MISITKKCRWLIFLTLLSALIMINYMIMRKQQVLEATVSRSLVISAKEVSQEVPLEVVPSKVSSEVPSEVPSKVPPEVPSDVPPKVPSDIPPKVPSDVPSEEFNCFSTKLNDSALSINMVIVPFLDYDAPEERILWRQREYKYVMRKNLVHPLVQCIHILTTNYTSSVNLFKDLPNQRKLHVVEQSSIETTQIPFQYISDNLVGKDVMFANADIYLGEGFHHIDPQVMDQKKILYSLTRRVSPEERCNLDKRYITDTDLCTEKSYTGSHDVFLFRLHEPLPESFLKDLNFVLASPGVENVLIWLFKRNLHYCVLNPCTILETFHYHCSNLRNTEGKIRVNNHGKSGTSPFTTKLVC